MLATAAVTMPVWLVVLLAVAGAVNAISSAGASFFGFLTTFLRFRQLHDTVKSIGRKLGMSDEELS